MGYQYNYDKIKRIIEIPLPETEVTIQDLINDIRDFEDEVIGIDIYKIADASGKEALGGGVEVGITLKLIDWKLKFADRPGPNWVNCNVRGGNLVAVEIDSTTGAETYVIPIEPSSFVTVSLTASSSATLQDLALTELKYRVESLKTSHRGTGNTYYWDPVNGDDSNNGIDPSMPVKTFSQAHSLATDGNHDVIICFPGDPKITITNEIINITKKDLFVRGPGRDFKIQPVITSRKPSVLINAEGVELSGLIVGTGTDSTVNAISIRADFPLLKDLWIENATENGVDLRSSDYGKIKNVIISGCRKQGINIGNNTKDLTIEDLKSYNNNGSGILLDGTNIQSVNIGGVSTSIFNNKECGIKIEKGSSDTVICEDITVMNNLVDDILDNGFQTVYSGKILRQMVSDQVWDEPQSNHNLSNTMGKAVLDNLEKISRAVGLMQENQYIDQNVYTTDANGNALLSSGRIRIYRDSTSVGTDKHILSTYYITATWGGANGNELQTYKVKKQWGEWKWYKEIWFINVEIVKRYINIFILI